jgi:hypothetical protein
MMTIQLTDTQRGLLAAAAQTDHRLLALPAGLKGGAAGKVGAKLIDAGLVREIAAKSETSVWRRDRKTDQAFALKLTAAGLKAVAAQRNASDATSAPKAELAKRKSDSDAHPAAKASAASDIRAPRDGSKISQVVILLQRENGATLEEMVKTTGWLAHTTRAALTGLRRRGFTIERRGRETGPRSYAIAVSQTAEA